MSDEAVLPGGKLRRYLTTGWQAVCRLAGRWWDAFKAEFGLSGPITWAMVARRRNLAFLGLPLFWLVVLLLELIPARDHGLRSILVVLTVALVAGSLRLGEERHPLGVLRGERLFVRLAMALAAIQAIFCLGALLHPELGNMATTTVAAARIMIAGGNPYAEPADPLQTGPEFDQGYKLLPAMAVGYLPLGLALGRRGVLLTNLVLQILVAAAMAAIAQGETERGRRDGALAVLLYLAMPVVPVRVFGDGATDLLPVLLAMLAILLADRRSLFAGIAAGLSCSASLMPVAAVLPLCIPGSTRGREQFFPGLVAGLVPTLLFCARAPGAFLHNALGMGVAELERPASALVGLPEGAAILIQGVAGVLWFLLGLLAWRQPLELEQRCGLAAVVILSATLLVPETRPSEILWWLPLAAIAVARPALLELSRLPDPREAADQARRMAARLSGLAERDQPGA